ncbi:MAG: cytidylate kinase family protein [Spirochaetales bacterium]
MSNNVSGIAVSGKSGCGNTTTSALLAHKLGFTLVNYTFRTLAVDEGLEFEQLRVLAEQDEKWDKLVDRRQVELARAHPSVLASRLALWMWQEAYLKVYLDAPLEVRAQRIWKREGGRLEAVREATRLRDEADHARYLKLYGIDNDDWAFAGLVIDVSTLTPDEIVAKILAHLEVTSGYLP